MSDGDASRRCGSQKTSLAPASRTINSIVPRTLEIHRHRDQARAHDAEAGGDIGAVGGEDCNPIAAC